MDIKEFTQDFIDQVDSLVEFEGSNRQEELTNSILEYVEDSGEIGFPTICSFKKKSAAISAYDYNDEGNSLDLFLLLEPDTFLGKVNDSKLDDAYNRMMRFYNESLDGTIEKTITDPNDEVLEVVELIKSTKGNIDTLRFFVLTTGLNDTYDLINEEIDNGLIYSQNLWDMQRVYQQHKIRSGKEKIEIDFTTNYETELQCLKVTSNNPDVDAYLAIIPGLTLARIYKQYQQSLLEQNVRTFLQFKAKVNRGIRETLKNEPDMFFSYNNGISTTATRINLKEQDGALFITHIYDWQIVNGGQTTASIAAMFSEKGTDLSKVYVPMKLSVINDKDKHKHIVPKISKSANSQTAVKDSDFSANDPYLVKLEEFSRNIWVPKENSKSTEKWYFERTRGQYLDELAQLTGLNERTFRTNYPKQHKITKTDLAKYMMCWDQRPDLVCKGAEKNYILFVKNIKEMKPMVSETYYKRTIAKTILYKTIDKMVKEKQLGGYKSNLDSYIMAALSAYSQKMLDLDHIWEHQKVQPEVETLIAGLIPIVWQHITGSTTSGAQSANVNEWTKKLDCWNTLKLKLNEFDAFPNDLKLSPEAMVDDSITPAQKDLIDKIWAYEADYWYALAQWAKANNQLTPLDRKMAYSFGTYRSRGKMFSLKQAQSGQKIINKAIELGFVK